MSRMGHGPWLRLCVADLADYGEDLQDAASDVGWHGHQQKETLPTRSLCSHWACEVKNYSSCGEFFLLMDQTAGVGEL